MTRFEGVAALLAEGIANRAFPAAAIEVGRADQPLWQQAFGTLTYDPASPRTDARTIFDLASLTKVLATTTLVMRAVDDRRVTLDDRIGRWLPAWRGADREDVTIRDLLAHASGLPAWLPFFRDCTGRAEFEAEICAVALEYSPRSASVYSDLGFILLGFILEDARGKSAGMHVPAATLAGQFRPIASYLTPEPLTFNPPRDWRDRIAPTEVDPWRGRLLVGEVHDENCWALGGAAGHAGLFGTASAVGAFARAVLRTLKGEPILASTDTLVRFIQRAGVPNSSRALGWDTMLPTSSCGTLLSPTAIGHTGFTGTSLWIDWERDLYVVLLTNRVHPTRENQGLRQIRPRVHDAVIGALSDSAR
jgi:CubicO group peptidase (beta-lactamase class C family)